MGFECDFVFLSGPGGIALSSLQSLLWLVRGVLVLLQHLWEDLALFEGQQVIILYQPRVGRETPSCGVCGGEPGRCSRWLGSSGIVGSLCQIGALSCFPDRGNMRFLPSAARGEVLKKVQIKSCQERQKFNKLVVCRYKHI